MIVIPTLIVKKQTVAIAAACLWRVVGASGHRPWPKGAPLSWVSCPTRQTPAFTWDLGFLWKKIGRAENMGGIVGLIGLG